MVVPAVRQHPAIRVGVMGEPEKASAEIGRQITEEAVGPLVELIERMRADGVGAPLPSLAYRSAGRPVARTRRPRRGSPPEPRRVGCSVIDGGYCTSIFLPASSTSSVFFARTSRTPSPSFAVTCSSSTGAGSGRRRAHVP